MKETLCDPSPAPEFLWGLAREYQWRTEAFDRTVCTGPVGRDGVMPISARQLTLIARNAKKVLDDLRRRAEAEGYTFEALRMAMRSYNNSPEAVADMRAIFPA